ncbi:MAG: glycoside hydrolase family 55 protein, partial [Chloroflexota bacterium]|nr:glycoside hydrolase family 55 protein [Chloroflexota bacterium]
MMAETAYITDFGAVGNGIHDDTQAILDAQKAMYDVGAKTYRDAAVVKIPEPSNYYRTTRAIDLMSDRSHRVRFVGEGDKPLIRNVTREGDHDRAPVFRAGRLVAGGSDFTAAKQLWRNMQPAEAGQKIVKFEGAGLDLSPDDMVFVAGGERMWHGKDTNRGNPADWYSTEAQISVVDFVDSEGVHLVDPLLDDHLEWQLCRYPYGVSYGGVRNLRLEQTNAIARPYGFPGVAGGGAYRMGYRDLHFPLAVSCFAVNGHARCLFENIGGNVAKKGIELA